jgi:hypothetical protein
VTRQCGQKEMLELPWCQLCCEQKFALNSCQKQNERKFTFRIKEALCFWTLSLPFFASFLKNITNCFISNLFLSCTERLIFLQEGVKCCCMLLAIPVMLVGVLTTAAIFIKLRKANSTHLPHIFASNFRFGGIRFLLKYIQFRYSSNFSRLHNFEKFLLNV